MSSVINTTLLPGNLLMKTNKTPIANTNVDKMPKQRCVRVPHKRQIQIEFFFHKDIHFYFNHDAINRRYEEQCPKDKYLLYMLFQCTSLMAHFSQTNKTYFHDS